MKEEIIERLTKYRQKEKIISSRWGFFDFEELDKEVCLSIEKTINDFTDAMIDLVNKHANTREIKKEIKKRLSVIKKKPFIQNEPYITSECLKQVCRILSVNFDNTLERWGFGWNVFFLYKVKRAIGRFGVKEIKQYICCNCDFLLEVIVYRRTSEFIEPCYDIIRCKLCKEFNLVDEIPNFKVAGLTGMAWIEQLPKKDYTYEEALVRLEQLRFFRK